MDGCQVERSDGIQDEMMKQNNLLLFIILVIVIFIMVLEIACAWLEAAG